jgi:hypothetical protein
MLSIYYYQTPLYETTSSMQPNIILPPILHVYKNPDKKTEHACNLKKLLPIGSTKKKKKKKKKKQSVPQQSVPRQSVEELPVTHHSVEELPVPLQSVEEDDEEYIYEDYDSGDSGEW